MIDLHLHILPNFDDGPSKEEVSVEMCRMAAKDGITKVIATPHVFGNFPLVPWEKIKERVALLQKRIEEEAVKIRIFPGAELHFDEQIYDLLDGEKMTLAGSGRYLLVEFPYTWVPHNFLDFFFRLQGKGYRPILAHPERNPEILSKPDILKEIVERGTFAQITAGSLLGIFGSEEARFSKKILKKGWVRFVGSDAHGLSGRPPKLSQAFGVVKKIMGRKATQELFFSNPQKVIEGEEIEPF